MASKTSNQSAVWVLFASCFLWNLCNGMLFVVTPLYAMTLGLSLLDISALVGLPYVATILIRFLGGAIADRFGEHRMLQGCYLFNTLGSLALASATGFGTLLGSSALANLSRSTFWVPAQSMASQLSQDNVGKGLGRLSAANYSGQLLGLSLGGVLSGLLGYFATFVVLNALTLLCALLGLVLPAVRRKPSGRSVWQITMAMGRRLCQAHTWLVISASAAAAVPFALTQSIYPVYMAQLNFPDQWISPAVALRSVGPVLTGLVLGPLITIHRERVLYAVGMTGLGVSVLGMAGSSQLWAVALCIGGLGIAGAVMDLLNQVQAVSISQGSDRSAVMASTGLGWNISPMILPIVLGWLAETEGFQLTFLVTGVFFSVVALGTPLLFRVMR